MPSSLSYMDEGSFTIFVSFFLAFHRLHLGSFLGTFLLFYTIPFLYFSIPLLNNRTDLGWGAASSIAADILFENLSILSLICTLQ